MDGIAEACQYQLQGSRFALGILSYPKSFHELLLMLMRWNLFTPRTLADFRPRQFRNRCTCNRFLRFEMCSRGGSRSAFTLLELLAIIVVLAMMASVMGAALARTGPKSKDLICLNNHRQLAAAMSMYTHDYHEFY